MEVISNQIPDDKLKMSIPSIYELAVQTLSELDGISEKIHELTYGPVKEEQDKNAIVECGSLQELFNVLDKMHTLSIDIRQDLNNLI